MFVKLFTLILLLSQPLFLERATAARGVELRKLDDRELSNTLSDLLIKIETFDPEDKVWRHSCTAFFINSQTAITAGHCYREFESQPQRRYLDYDGNELELNRLVISPNYTKEVLRHRFRNRVYEINIYNDYALLVFKDQENKADVFEKIKLFESISPEALAALETKEEAIPWMTAGYGMKKCYGLFGETPDGIARAANLGTINTFKDTRVDFNQEDEGTCPGDSGGPLFIWEDGKITFVGVVSQFVPQRYKQGLARFQLIDKKSLEIITKQQSFAAIK